MAQEQAAKANKNANGFKLDKHVATPVTVQFQLEGDAELFAIRFDELFWE